MIQAETKRRWSRICPLNENQYDRSSNRQFQWLDPEFASMTAFSVVISANIHIAINSVTCHSNYKGMTKLISAAYEKKENDIEVLLRVTKL